jgi:hypothetical protein
MLKAYDAQSLPNPPRWRALAWLRARFEPRSRVETAVAAKPPRPPVGIASDADAGLR